MVALPYLILFLTPNCWQLLISVLECCTARVDVHLVTNDVSSAFQNLTGVPYGADPKLADP